MCPARERTLPGETPIRVTPKEKADKEHRKALRVRENKALPDGERELRYCCHMLQWATLKAEADPDSAIRWSAEAVNWSKQVQRARDTIYYDELADIRAKLDKRDANAERLKKLVR